MAQHQRETTAAKDEYANCQRETAAAKEESDQCKTERDNFFQALFSLKNCTAKSESFKETCTQTAERLNHTLSKTKEDLKLCLNDRNATKLELESLKTPIKINSKMGFLFDATNTNAVADAVADERNSLLSAWLNPAHLWTVIGMLLLVLLLVVAKMCYDKIKAALEQHPRTSENVWEYTYSTFVRRDLPRHPPTPVNLPPALPQQSLPPTAAQDDCSIYNEIVKK